MGTRTLKVGPLKDICKLFRICFQSRVRRFRAKWMHSTMQILNTRCSSSHDSQFGCSGKQTSQHSHEDLRQTTQLTKRRTVLRVCAGAVLKAKARSATLTRHSICSDRFQFMEDTVAGRRESSPKPGALSERNCLTLPDKRNCHTLSLINFGSPQRICILRCPGTFWFSIRTIRVEKLQDMQACTFVGRTF